MFINLLIFINFVLISSGKTKFSMASCVYHNWKNCMIYLPQPPDSDKCDMACHKNVMFRTSLRTARFHIQVLVDVYDCLVAAGKCSLGKMSE